MRRSEEISTGASARASSSQATSPPACALARFAETLSAGCLLLLVSRGLALGSRASPTPRSPASSITPRLCHWGSGASPASQPLGGPVPRAPRPLPRGRRGRPGASGVSGFCSPAALPFLADQSARSASPQPSASARTSGRNRHEHILNDCFCRSNPREAPRPPLARLPWRPWHQHRRRQPHAGHTRPWFNPADKLSRYLSRLRLGFLTAIYHNGYAARKRSISKRRRSSTICCWVSHGWILGAIYWLHCAALRALPSGRDQLRARLTRSVGESVWAEAPFGTFKEREEFE
jgi:hypothetical protein